MSDRPADFNDPSDPAPSAPVLERSLVKTEAVEPGAGQVWLVSRNWAVVVIVLAAAGLVVSALLWQKLGGIQEELARRSADAGTQSVEARTLAKQAQEGTADLLARMALFETRISEASLQRSQLEELMQSLSRSRDENLVVDVESAIRLAQQQAQLTGSAEPLLAALRTADQRLSRAAQPRLNPLQRAIAHDSDRIKAAVVTDVPGLLLKLDELVRSVDELPAANAMAVGSTSTPAVKPAAPPSPSLSHAATPPKGAASAPAATVQPSLWAMNRASFDAWSSRALQSIRDEARNLLRVSRIDQPDAMLLAPEQTFFLRENLKLRLLNARLNVLSRQTDSARSDLTVAGAALTRYFDPASRKTLAAQQLLQQVQGQLKSTELPRLDETLAALATAAAGR